MRSRGGLARARASRAVGARSSAPLLPPLLPPRPTPFPSRACRYEAYSASLDGVLTFFLTMELCEGGDLSRRLARAAAAHREPRAGGGGAIDARAISRWAIELAAGLAAVHAACVAHRDLKV